LAALIVAPGHRNNRNNTFAKITRFEQIAQTLNGVSTAIWR
jgi:hypothetical protein